MILTQLSENNFKEVATLEKKCFTNEAWSENQFKEEINDDSKYYAVCVCDNKVVGFGGYIQVFDEAYITNIAVDQDYRRKGIASEILKNLIDNGVVHGINAFTLEVRVSNSSAIALYEKFGFKNVGIRKNFYPDKEDAYIFWLYI